MARPPLPEETCHLVEEGMAYLADRHLEAAPDGGLCLLVSWGKDSVAMLELALAAGLRPDLVTFEEPYNRHRAAHARRCQEHYAGAYGLRVHTPPPESTWAYQLRGGYVLGASFSLGGGYVVDMPKDVLPWEAGEPRPQGAVCGLHDHLAQPAGSWAPPWALAAVAHKDGDSDPLLGSIPLDRRELATPDGAMDLCFPLKEWTDADVWAYLHARGAPADPRKYDLSAPAPHPPHPDRTWNTDYLHACVRCLRAAPSELVPCPRRGGSRVHGIEPSVPKRSTLEHEYFSAEFPAREPDTTTAQP